MRFLIFSSILFLTALTSTYGGESAHAFLNYYNVHASAVRSVMMQAEFRQTVEIGEASKAFYTNMSQYVNEQWAQIYERALKVDTSNATTDELRQMMLITKNSMHSSNETVEQRSSELSSIMLNTFASASIPYNKSIVKSIKVNASTTRLDLYDHLDKIMSDSRNPQELLYVWDQWRKETGPALKASYVEYVNLMNIGAHVNNFTDAGAVKRSEYEVGDLKTIAEDFWIELKDMYKELYGYVRYRLSAVYPNHIRDGAPMPAHLLGEMYAAAWHEIFPLIKPYPEEPVLDITPTLKQKNTVDGLVKLSEDFFTSLGWPNLPQTFWNSSMLRKPTDRNVSCQASAWDMFNDIQGQPDVRISTCTEISFSHYNTLHHELGHVYYFLLYHHLPVEYRTGANPGFHEAVGETILLSAKTPQHLHAVGLLEKVSTSKNAEINFLLRSAMENVAFIPYSLIMDKWMWGVYSGQIPPSQYNAAWWKLRLKYQGLVPPNKRADDGFDIGSKSHISDDTPYIRYFFANVLKFVFHKHACQAANNTQPLHKCSIYNSTQAGKRLGDMLALGKSVQWQQALKNLTGSERLSAAPLREYYAPLNVWLRQQRAQHKYSLDWMDDKNPGYSSANALPPHFLLIIATFVAVHLVTYVNKL